MKPIAGSVVSSKPVSLSKAATILSRFVVSDTGAHQDVSAFLRRTSEAFDELVRFRKELGAQREVSGNKDGEEVDRRKKEAAAVVEAAQDGNFAEIEGSRRKKKKKKEEAAGVEAGQDGHFVEIGGDPGTSAGRHGGGALDIRESKSGSREKKRVAKEIESRLCNGVEMDNEKRNKTELKRTKHEDVKEGKEEGYVENHSERRRKKKRKKEDIKEENGGGVENHVEHHHKKKRRVKEES